MVAKFASCLVAALVCLGASCTSADDFAERCKQLAQQVKVSVTFEDLPVVIDESRSIQALNGFYQ